MTSFLRVSDRRGTGGRGLTTDADAEIKDVRNRSKEVLSRIKEAEGGRAVEILESALGIGAAVLAVIVSEAFDSVRKADLQALRCCSGVAPVTKRSGRTILVRRRLAANRASSMPPGLGPWPPSSATPPAGRIAMRCEAAATATRAPSEASRTGSSTSSQDDRNRTDLRPGTALESRTPEPEKKRLTLGCVPPPRNPTAAAHSGNRPNNRIFSTANRTGGKPPDSPKCVEPNPDTNLRMLK